MRSSPLQPIHFVASVSQVLGTKLLRDHVDIVIPTFHQEFNGGCSLLAISVIVAFMAIITIQFIGPENAIVSK